MFTDITYSQSIYRALTFLVISCPCAIAISVPLSYFSGIGVASKKGILIKGSEVLDNIKNITKIAFDKTGTLTTGKFNITKITSLDDKYSEDDIFKYIYFAEKYSLHPLAKTVLNYKKVKEEKNTLNLPYEDDIYFNDDKYSESDKEKWSDFIRKLNKTDRDILYLVCVQGMDYKEIADSFEISYAAAKQRYWTAKNNLKKIILKEGEI